MKTYSHLLLFITQFFLKREMFHKIRKGNKNAHFMRNNFFPYNRAVYERCEKNSEQPDRPQMTIWRMCITCWTPKATNTDSEYVILTAFPLQQ